MFKKAHKADYIAFNVALVKEVEKHPCLYDYSLKEYSNREIVQDTWETIANNFNCTAKDCRDTWKNLRIVFSRNIKKASFEPAGGKKKKKKPYYLLDSMRYLMPFMKIDNSSPTQVKFRSEAAYYETTSDEHNSNREDEEDYINSFNDQSANITELEVAIKEEIDSTDEQIPQETPRKKQKTQDKNKIDADEPETPQCDCSKSKTVSSSSNRTDSKHQFLMSLLPDLDDMSEAQFRSFRLEVCKLINHTFSSQPVPVQSSQYSGRNSSWTSFQYQPVVNLGNKYPGSQQETEK